MLCSSDTPTPTLLPCTLPWTAPGLISLPSLFQHQQPSYCSNNCSAMPKLTRLSHSTQDLISQGAAQDLSLLCIEMMRIISLGLVSALPAMCSHLTT